MSDTDRVLENVKWKAIVKGWTKRDYQRVLKKLKAVCTPSLEFDDVECLSIMLEEPIDYKLYYSLMRAVKDDNFCLVKKDGYYILDYVNF